MTRALPPIQQRCAALALLGVALTLLWMGFFNPLTGYWRHSADERVATLDSLRRDRALISQDAATQATLSALGASPRWVRFYDTQGVDKAVLQLQSDLREVFKEPNNPTSMTALPAMTLGPLTRLGTKLTLSLTIEQLTESLARLQSHARLLQIENLTIQAPDYQPADTNPTLTIQADIVGFMTSLPRVHK